MSTDMPSFSSINPVVVKLLLIEQICHHLVGTWRVPCPSPGMTLCYVQVIKLGRFYIVDAVSFLSVVLFTRKKLINFHVFPIDKALCH